MPLLLLISFHPNKVFSAENVTVMFTFPLLLSTCLYTEIVFSGCLGVAKVVLYCSLETCIAALRSGWCQITFVDLTLQVVKAFVVLSPTFSSSDLESLTCDLQEHVKKTTAPYKYPRKVNVSEEKL